MDEITVFDENGKELYCLYESPLMGCSSKRWYLLTDMFLILPKSICEFYIEWSKFSTIDGDNQTAEIILNGVRYVFTNHYWD